jgi:amino acid transporter
MYSLASTLGDIGKALGPGSSAAPAVLLIAFIPILCIAVAFDRLNRIDPDCGTTFAWVTRAMGPWMGWMAGWATVLAGALVMASLAQVSAAYTFELVGWEALAASRSAMAAAGSVWIIVITAICARGIESAARGQYLLLGLELAAMLLFAVAALAHSGSAPAQAVPPAHGGGTGLPGLASAVLIAVFLYWGWESTASMNEETRGPARTPGRAGLASVVILLPIYVLVTAAAQSVHGPAYLIEHAQDVFAALGREVLPAPWDRLLVLGVLASAVAAAQTTLIPTARTILSMAAAGALPSGLARVHPRFLTPHVATWALGLASCAWFAALSFASTDVLWDSNNATALLVAFYYAVTGYACPILYGRAGTRSWSSLLLVAALPLAGAAALSAIFASSCVTLAEPGRAGTLLGVGVPLVVGVGGLLLGAVLMATRRVAHPRFFAAQARNDAGGGRP